jgi:hypothetical protein
MARKTVPIRIRASQQVHYDQVVNLTPEEWEKLKAIPEGILEAGAMGGYLDLSNVDDGGDFEIMDIVRLGSSGKPTKDEYGR